MLHIDSPKTFIVDTIKSKKFKSDMDGNYIDRQNIFRFASNGNQVILDTIDNIKKITTVFSDKSSHTLYFKDDVYIIDQANGIPISTYTVEISKSNNSITYYNLLEGEKRKRVSLVGADEQKLSNHWSTYIKNDNLNSMTDQEIENKIIADLNDIHTTDKMYVKDAINITSMWTKGEYHDIK